MLKRLLFLFVVAPGFAMAQSHTIDAHEVFMTGDVEDADIYNNTYYQAIDQVQVDWSIIEVDGPEGWEYSFCFPNCHNIGVVSGNNTFPAASEQYLNCHVYPNGIAGEGLIRMLLTTNASAQDTVTWYATIEGVSSVDPAPALSIAAHPNPVTDRLNLTGLPLGSLVTLQDAAGHMVQHIRHSTAGPLHLTDLPVGLLILTVTEDNTVLHRQRILSY